MLVFTNLTQAGVGDFAANNISYWSSANGRLRPVRGF